MNCIFNYFEMYEFNHYMIPAWTCLFLSNSLLLLILQTLKKKNIIIFTVELIVNKKNTATNKWDGRVEVKPVGTIQHKVKLFASLNFHCIT